MNDVEYYLLRSVRDGIQNPKDLYGNSPDNLRNTAAVVSALTKAGFLLGSSNSLFSITKEGVAALITEETSRRKIEQEKREAEQQREIAKAEAEEQRLREKAAAEKLKAELEQQKAEEMTQKNTERKLEHRFEIVKILITAAATLFIEHFMEILQFFKKLFEQIS